jgi:two-component system OmpR family sensor kinase
VRIPSPRDVLERTPLRVTLVVALVLLAAVGLTATGAVVTSLLRGYLVQQVDKDLVASTRRAPQPGDLGGPGDGPFETSRDEYFGFTATNGTGLRGRTNTDVRPPALTAAQIRTAGRAPFTVPSRGHGPDWRVVVTGNAVLTSTGQPVLVVHAVSLADVENTTHQLVAAELLAGAVVLALLGGLAYVVVRTSLRPLVEVEHTAASIAAGDLSQRVPERDRRTEVGRLSRALNGMLAQIESAFRSRQASEAAARASEDRMRRFVADASHELRTPLTSIRGFAELYRQGAVPEPADVDRVMRRVEDEAARMGLLVEDLLLLARLDQQRPLARNPVDLLAIARDAVHDATTLAPDRSVDLVVLEAADAPVVLGDEPRLRQVVSNLMSNALTHTPQGVPVTVTVGVEAPPDAPARAVLAVADAGPGLAPDEAGRVFERFYRADQSRSRGAGGTGLGLSIVAALVAAHGGTVDVATAPGQGSTFTVRLPLPAPTVGSQPRGTASTGSSQVAGPR